jgi:two-component system, LytTR family, response regulator
MLRVVVVDDEPLARQGMRQLFAKHPSVELAGEAGSVAAAADLIRRVKPDAVFLDIEMHSGTGFDLLRDLPDPPDIVFVTAHNQYALKAYDVAATDYLLKPVNPKRLAIAIERLNKARKARLAGTGAADKAPVLRLKTRARMMVVRADAIVAMQAEGDYTRVFAEKTPAILASQSLGKLEALLPKPPFVRLSRSLMINGARLREIEYMTRDSTRIWLNGCADSFVLGRAAAAKLRKDKASDPAAL